MMVDGVVGTNATTTAAGNNNIILCIETTKSTRKTNRVFIMAITTTNEEKIFQIGVGCMLILTFLSRSLTLLLPGFQQRIHWGGEIMRRWCQCVGSY
jgi:hypothetical protein